jgi:hypothetical protein
MPLVCETVPFYETRDDSSFEGNINFEIAMAQRAIDLYILSFKEGGGLTAKMGLKYHTLLKLCFTTRENVYFQTFFEFTHTYHEYITDNFKTEDVLLKASEMLQKNYELMKMLQTLN